MINATPIRPLSPSSSTSFTSTSSSVAPTTDSVNTEIPSTAPASAATPTNPKDPKRKFNLKYVFGGLFLLLLLVGGGAGLYLMRMNQDVRQQAYGGGCSSAGASQCVDGKKEVCDGSTWRGTSESCTVTPGNGGGGCTAGSCVGGKRCEYDPVSGKGYVGSKDCTVGNCNFRENSCSASEYCDDGGTCRSRRSTGTACDISSQCASGVCTNKVCIGTNTNIGCTTDNNCPSGFVCNSASGKCEQPLPPSPTPASGNCPAGSTTITGGVDAGACKCADGTTVESNGSCGGIGGKCNSSTTCCNTGGCKVKTWVKK